MASSQGVGVVRAQYPQLVGQQFGVRDHGTGRVPRRLLPPGQIPAGDEGVGVVGAEMAVSAVYQVLEVGGGDIDLAAVTRGFRRGGTARHGRLAGTGRLRRGG